MKPKEFLNFSFHPKSMKPKEFISFSCKSTKPAEFHHFFTKFSHQKLSKTDEAAEISLLFDLKFMKPLEFQYAVFFNTLSSGTPGILTRLCLRQHVVMRLLDIIGVIVWSEVDKSLF